MNKKLLILLICLMTTSWFYAQGPGPGRERIRTLKIAFITERVGLTPQEAQNFWPIYNEYDKNLEGIRKQERNQMMLMRNINDLSDKEASNFLDKVFNLRNEKHILQQEFIERIIMVIPTKKALLLIKAEEDFNRRLLQQIRKRRGGG